MEIILNITNIKMKLVHLKFCFKLETKVQKNK